MSDTTMENEDLLRLAIGGRKLRRRRLSRAMLARLIGQRLEPEDEEEEGEEGSSEGEERRIVRLLIGSRLLRRRRLRNLLLAHLLRERGEADSGKESDEDAKLRHLLLTPLIEHSRAKRLLQREVLNRAMLETLIQHSMKSEAAPAPGGPGSGLYSERAAPTGAN